MVLVVGELSDAGEAGASVVPRWSVAVGGCRLLSVRAEVGGQWRVEVGGGKRSVVGFWRFLVWFGLVVGGWWSVGGRSATGPATRGWTESDVGGRIQVMDEGF
jgi:predicted deacylase